MDEERSLQACPVCGEHRLALDAPPRIDVMGVQVNSDLLGMGDLPQAGGLGIVCLSCGTRWASREAFQRGEPELEKADAADIADRDVDEAGTPQ